MRCLPSWTRRRLLTTPTDPAALHEQRRSALVRGYRLSARMGWGSAGEGHITARDPLRPDCFWLARLGVPFNFVTLDDLILVDPDGAVVEGTGRASQAAYAIHRPVLEARPDLVSAAHFHTPYGTPFSALVSLLQPLSQECCAFFDDHAIFDDETLLVESLDVGRSIATAVGDTQALILRNHGLLTTGGSVESAVATLTLMERAAETQIKPSWAAHPDRSARRPQHRRTVRSPTKR